MIAPSTNLRRTAKDNDMETLGYIFGGVLAGLRQVGDSRVASFCDVVHSSMRLGDAIEQPKSQIKAAVVTLAAVGLGFAILNSAVESRKCYYHCLIDISVLPSVVATPPKQQS